MRKTLNRFVVGVLAIAVISGSMWYSDDSIKTVKAADDYEVVWEDNFNGNSLDRSVWNVEVNGNGGGNQELQYYCDNTENIEVSGGTLKIRGLRKSYLGKNYTSGRINTKGKAEFKYGKIEARIKLPSFQGAWPAFWMLGGSYDAIGWPRCGEIDIMEAINTENFTHGALHWYGEGQKDSGGDSASVLPDNFDRTQWHTYAIEWNKTTMRFAVDENVFFTQDITDGYMGEFRKKQFIILNLAIGGQWPGFTIDDTAFPATMEIDYVKVSQKASDEGTVTGSGVSNTSVETAPIETENRNVLANKGAWNIFFNDAVVKGRGTSTDSSGYTAYIDYLGIKSRLINASIKDLDYIAGKTYKYSFKITSDIQKNVLVKVLGEDPEEDVFANCVINLEVGKTYDFSENVTIDKDYVGRLDLVIEMGGRIGGEFLDSDTSLTIKMADASFIGEAEVLKEIPTQNTTEKITANTVDNTSEINTTKGAVVNMVTTVYQGKLQKNTVGKLQKVKIKSVKRSKNGRAVSLKLKRVKNAAGYQIRYSTSKNFKRYKNKNVVKLNYTIKKLQIKRVYYIKVRAYKKVNGKISYGAWCKAKKIKKK